MDDSEPAQICQELWLDGGNLVIRAENTLFKVFAALLAIASPIFKDMFGVPQPADSALETYEGLPFVRLPDKAFDVTQFLKALTYPGYIEEEIEKRLAVLASTLRMGTKYNVAYLRKLAVTKLLSVIPLTLDEYDTYYEDENLGDIATIACITLGKECAVPAILPFCLLLYTPETPGDIEKYLRCDYGPCTTEDGSAYDIDAATSMPCLTAGWKMAQQRQDNISWAVAGFACEHKQPPCRGYDYVLALAGALRGDPHPEDKDGIRIFNDVGSKRWQSIFHLCVTCAKKADQRWCTRRTEAWDALPSYYGLVSWQELIAASQ